MRKQALSTLLFTSLTSAHFILLWPTTAGFDEDKQPTSPCGDFTPVVNSSAPDVQVDRFAISIQNVHPVGQWGFRATTDTEAPYNFTDIVPLVNTKGVGDFCLDYMSVPSDWAGQSGIIQVVDNSPDGILFQCAPVNFVSGSNSTTGATCSNSSSFMSAEWSSQQEFKGETGGSQTTTAASSSSSGMAPIATGVGSLVGGIGLLAAGLVL